METEITTIPLVKMAAGIPCDAPDRQSLLLREDEPALAVMTDFSRIMPITIEPIMTIDYALHKMMRQGVRMLLVTGEHDYVIGIITSYDIQGEKPVKYSEETGLNHNNIKVAMIMTPLNEVAAFDLNFVKQSLVRHVVNTLCRLHRPHALVVTSDKTGAQRICGMFSTSHIGRCLGKDLNINVHAAPSLAEIQRELAHQ
jgi:CBS domain-containing protein